MSLLRLGDPGRPAFTQKAVLSLPDVFLLLAIYFSAFLHHPSPPTHTQVSDPRWLFLAGMVCREVESSHWKVAELERDDDLTLQISQGAA